jgi:hypothetical protein
MPAAREVRPVHRAQHAVPQSPSLYGDAMVAVDAGLANVGHIGKTNTSSSRGPAHRSHDPNAYFDWSCVTSLEHSLPMHW